MQPIKKIKQLIANGNNVVIYRSDTVNIPPKKLGELRQHFTAVWAQMTQLQAMQRKIGYGCFEGKPSETITDFNN